MPRRPSLGLEWDSSRLNCDLGIPESGVLIQDAGWAEGQHRWEPGRSLESEREWLLGRLRSWAELTLPMLHVREKVVGQEAHTGIPSARDGFRQNGPRRWEPIWTCSGLFRRAREAKNVVLKTGRHQFVSAETVSIRHRPTRFAEQDRLSAHAPSRTTSASCVPVPCQFQLSGRNLDQAAEGYRQGRVASRRTLCPRRLHRDEHEPARPSASLLSTTARDVRAMDQGGQRRDQVDATVPNVRRQRGAAPAFLRSPTTSAISCARWRRRSRSRTGR